jgi:hypothetical protein
MSSIIIFITKHVVEFTSCTYKKPRKNEEEKSKWQRLNLTEASPMLILEQ